ncbi:hypothetical protein F503_03813 [Ophiostoma piceae UAMH 11346]|uniref:Uncharacterized protein n=1 Tax=Ophiostoma piceae (strain UAMH 11346) TaxID=1262450 RepID=S3CG31_OPHP1|nr:hypothetical protein F503_03813 [Ophiostoma piceae UAMH 11346]
MSSIREAEKSSAGADVDVAILKPTLTAREQEILMAAWLSIKGPEPQIDNDKLAVILGLKNAHTASTIFYNVKKKIRLFRAQSEGAADDTQPQPAPSTPKSTPRKRTKTLKSTKSAKRVKSEATVPLDDDEEAI